MSKYLITSNESERFLRFLKDHKSIDQDCLYILYPEGKTQIEMPGLSFDIIKEIREAKCQIEFIECKNYTDDDTLNLVYTLGTLAATSPDIMYLTDDPVISQFAQNPKKTRAKRLSGKSKTANKKTDRTEPFMNEPEIETPRAEEKHLEKKAGRPKKDPKADDFDKNFDNFVKFLESHKTKQFNPASHINTILKAIKNSQKEGTAIQEELRVWCRETVADALIVTFGNDFDEMIKLANKIKE